MAVTTNLHYVSLFSVDYNCQKSVTRMTFTYQKTVIITFLADGATQNFLGLKFLAFLLFSCWNLTKSIAVSTFYWTGKGLSV